MLPVSIVTQLAGAGCDTEAVSARPDLRGAPDAEVLDVAARDGRILVTDNVRDFVALSSLWAGQGRTHPGIVLISSKTFPMTRSRSGQIAAALLRRCTSDRWPTEGQWDFLQR